MTLFTDPQSVHNPTATGIPPATWGDLVRDDLVYLNARGPLICTSATRPGSPFHGQMIYETDTHELLQFYSGPSQWRRPWRMPWGRVASATITSTTGSTVAIADAAGLSVTFTAIGNRRYQIRFNGASVGTNSTDVLALYIATGANVQLQRGVQAPGIILSGNNWAPWHLEIEQTPAAGSVTYKIRHALLAGAGASFVVGAADVPSTIQVLDIGPNGNPA